MRPTKNGQALAFLLAVAATTPARASDPDPSKKTTVAISTPTCATVSADTTLTFGANVPSVMAISPGANVTKLNVDPFGTGASATRGHPSCMSYIVDVSVGTAAAQAPSGYLSSFGFAEQATDHSGTAMKDVSQTQCSTFSEELAVYKKASGQTSFTVLVEASWHGVWQSSGLEAGCHASADAGWTAPTVQPPTRGTDTYRLVGNAHLDGKAIAVTLQAIHVLAPAK
jgi:hypothetical protein